MDDTRLIVEVEKRKVIYDPQDVMYKDVQVKERAWEAVADAVGVDVSECKRRWKLLRDAFVRNQKESPVAQLVAPSGNGSTVELCPFYCRICSLEETCDFDAEVSEFSRPYSPMTVTQRSVTPSQTTLGPDTSIPPTTSRPHTHTPTLHPRVQQLMTEGQPPRQRRRNISPSSTEQHLLDIITQPTTPAPPQIPKQEEETYYSAFSSCHQSGKEHDSSALHSS
ncbi:hypothetical protein E1301_Tti014650 [Triplophysa tibetana]|uniref:MADF domain-containing protein n=1 Tax=Triplophysa tibetana TaxID=1572043 RepID=A0A5A9PJI2_9TELE|nr:hypothetical protein E1301_Tti014650 [Triplophysa tibetana]